MTASHPDPASKGWNLTLAKLTLRVVAVLIVSAILAPVFNWLEEDRIPAMRKWEAALNEAIDQFSPFFMVESFNVRLANEHGWRLLSFRAPFNLKVAKDELAERYPRAAARAHSVIDMTILDPNRKIDPALEQEISDYRDAVARIERYAFPGWVPSIVRTAAGAPDAFLFMVRSMFRGNWIGAAIGIATLLVAAFTLRAGLGAWLLLPTVMPLTAWLLFRPVVLASWLLAYLLHPFGVTLLAPQLTLLTSSFGWWASEKLLEHRLTEMLIHVIDAYV